MNYSVVKNAVAKLGKNEPVSFETLERICRALKCDVGDIMEIEFTDVSEGEKQE